MSHEHGPWRHALLRDTTPVMKGHHAAWQWRQRATWLLILVIIVIKTGLSGSVAIGPSGRPCAESLMIETFCSHAPSFIVATNPPPPPPAPILIKNIHHLCINRKNNKRFAIIHVRDISLHRDNRLSCMMFSWHPCEMIKTTRLHNNWNRLFVPSIFVLLYTTNEAFRSL